VTLKLCSSRFLFIPALILGNGLLLTPEGSPPRVAGALILFLLPGLTWADRWLPPTLPFTRWIIGAGLSYSMVMISGLILHYLPGPIPFWAELLTLNILALAPLLLRSAPPQPHHNKFPLRFSTLDWILLMILFSAAFFRFTSLGYSEFQGDEIKAMRPAAQALEGHENALFLYRKKGPGEALLPMMLWRLTGVITELTARLPFAIAGLLLIPLVYLLGERLLNKWAGLVAAGLLALNGLMVAFSRIVQYQTIVIWLSALALLCLLEWRERGHTRWMILVGVFLGAGLLGHYDTVFVTPALAYGVISSLKLWPITRRLQSALLSLAAAAGCLLIISGLFYLPYATIEQQVEQTVDYLDKRISMRLVESNWDYFLQVNFFYNSFYYLIVTGLLTFGLLAWALHHNSWVRRVPGGPYWAPALALILPLGLMIWPEALLISGLDLAVLPFALIFLGAFLSPVFGFGPRTLVVWLAVPFLVYNFVIAQPGTHTYTAIPAWMLLAGLAATKVWDVAARQRCMIKATLPETRFLARTELPWFRRRSWILFFYHPSLLIMVSVLLAALFSGYLYIVYLRHDLEYKQDWPESRSSFYWSPYGKLLSEIALFGYVHQSGWKTMGALYANGQLSGDYGGNEQVEITSWYIQDRLRTCQPQPKYYFAADAPLGLWQFNANIDTAHYTAIGRAALPNGKGITIYQVSPPTENLGYVDTELLKRAFDRTATPAAFAYTRRESRRLDIRLAGPIQLARYELDVLKARPGGQFQVILYWQTQEPIPADYHVFAHLEGEGGAASAAGIWGQSNGRPACQLYPTSEWRPYQLIPDPHQINISPDTPPGEYAILVGMYQPDTGIRLDVLDKAGTPVANFVKLTTVTIGQ
jgi:4-amino-4-deoxy-L-arabinose transferase-like glycosyltransferase